MKHFPILGGLAIAASLIAPLAVMGDDSHRDERWRHEHPDDTLFKIEIR